GRRVGRVDRASGKGKLTGFENHACGFPPSYPHAALPLFASEAVAETVQLTQNPEHHEYLPRCDPQTHLDAEEEALELGPGVLLSYDDNGSVYVFRDLSVGAKHRQPAPFPHH